MTNQNVKKYLAEALGAFTLTLVVALSIAVPFPVPTPLLAGLVLGLFVYTIGHLSGSHINPAVTIGLWSIKKITAGQAALYIIFQLAGAWAAGILVSSVVGITPLTVSGDFIIGFAEALGTFFFTFGIASVVYGKVSDVMSGIVIGGSLFLGIVVAVTLSSNGVLNPAVAMGIGSFNVMYLLGPIVGCVAGMQAYKYLCSK